MMKWSDELNLPASVSWPKCFTSLYALTDDYKLRWLQLRILHRIVPTNGRLFLYDILPTDNCVRCSGVRESLLHLFWQCPAVLHFWAQLTRVLSLGTQLTAQSVILGSKLGRSCAPEKQIYVCILLGKWYIWRCRFNKTKPNIQGFIRMGIDYIRVERYAAMMTDSIDKFNCNWFQLNEILKNSQHPP